RPGYQRGRPRTGARALPPGRAGRGPGPGGLGGHCPGRGRRRRAVRRAAVGRPGALVAVRPRLRRPPGLAGGRLCRRRPARPGQPHDPRHPWPDRQRALRRRDARAGNVQSLAELVRPTPQRTRTMLWEIEIRPRGQDAERNRVVDEYNLLTHEHGGGLVGGSARGYLLEGRLSRHDAERLLRELLVDELVEVGRLGSLNEGFGPGVLATVLLAPGVMDPTALSVRAAARDLGVEVDSVRTYRRYFGPELSSPEARETLFRRVLANEAIEQVIE